jgi:hypothetical protein
MFEKLLSLLLHAKGGALATVLVIGASGALVTATVENGLTTVTVTQPSTTTGTDTTTTTTTTDPVILALFNRTNADEDPTSTATGNGCSDAAKATNEQVRAINAAWQTDHQLAVAQLKDAKTEAARKLILTADKDLKDIRQAAVKALHELFKSDECKGNDDEDENNEDNDDEDDSSTTGTTTGTTAGTTTTTTGVSVAFSGEDAKAIADLAITAMDAKVAKLQADLAALTPTTTNDNKGKSDSNKSDKSKSSDNKGKGHTEGLSHDNEDDD